MRRSVAKVHPGPVTQVAVTGRRSTPAALTSAASGQRLIRCLGPVERLCLVLPSTRGRHPAGPDTASGTSPRRFEPALHLTPKADSRRSVRPRRPGQAGQIMVLVAIGAVVIVGMVGLGLDAGLSYMNRTTLQGAADTASQTGARMLSADFQASSGAAPFPLATVTSTVQNVLDASSAGPTAAHAFTGFLVTGSTGSDASLCATTLSASVPPPGPDQCIVCQFFPTTSLPFGGSYCTASDLGNPGPMLVDGAEVFATNTSATPFLGVLGITHASQAANATSIFGLPVAAAPYAVWYDCFSASPSLTPWTSATGTPKIGYYVMYYNNKGGGTGYQNEATCNAPGDTDASFKGDLHQPFYPVPPQVPGWFNAGGGVRHSALTPIAAGSKFLLPFVTCLDKSHSWPFTTACPAAYSNAQCGSGSGFTPPSPAGAWDLCIVGYAYVRAVNDCNYGSSGTSTPCIARIISNPNLVGGGFLCDPVGPNPPCANAAGTSGAESVVTQLYRT